MTTRLPISSLIQWAAAIDSVDAVFLLRDAAGQVRVASTDGQFSTILPLVEEAVASFGDNGDDDIPAE
jgi:hypothetical protein